VDVSPASRDFLLKKGTSEEYGARELKRTLHRHVTQPLATLVASGQLEPGAKVHFEVSENGESLALRTVKVDAVAPQQQRVEPTILIVDDNHQLLGFLKSELSQAGWEMLTAETSSEAQALFSEKRPATVLLDYMLGEDDGLKLGLQLIMQSPDTNIIVMTGGELGPEEQKICEQLDIPVLHKPFLASDVLHLIGYRLQRSAAASK